MTHLEKTHLKREREKFKKELFPLIKKVSDCVLNWTQGEADDMRIFQGLDIEDTLRGFILNEIFGDIMMSATSESEENMPDFYRVALQRLTRKLLPPEKKKKWYELG